MTESGDRATYRRHLKAAYDWLERSRSPVDGGSRAYFAPVLGWRRSYPETTGYIIPTVLRAGDILGESNAQERALRYGSFLLGIQRPEGAWFGLEHPPKGAGELSVFNTAQILKGMCALHDRTGDPRWLDAAVRGADWLAAGVDANGSWQSGNYRNSSNPTYYTQVAWPMLEVWKRTDSDRIKESAIRVLDALARRQTETGAYREWGFSGSDTGFTHTIAYTLRGFLESARLLDAWDRYGAPAQIALDRLVGLADEKSGRLAGAYDLAWTPEASYTCLTGNAQVAICLMRLKTVTGRKNYGNTARALVDEVCRHHALSHPVKPLAGAVAGSHPLWGRYMRFRYPNWAAKYLSDALIALLDDEK